VWALSAFPGDDRWILGMMREAGAPDLPYLAAHDDPEAALGLLASADLVVAERLHAAVLAAAVGTVPVMVEYRPKLRDFAMSVGVEGLVIRSDAVGGGALESLCAQAYTGRDSIASEMRQRVDELVAMQRLAAAGLQREIAG